MKMVTHPLIQKRLENMLRQDGTVRMFGYQKAPFRIVEEKEWNRKI